jgi:hypothetical protein
VVCRSTRARRATLSYTDRVGPWRTFACDLPVGSIRVDLTAVGGYLRIPAIPACRRMTIYPLGDSSSGFFPQSDPATNSHLSK